MAASRAEWIGTCVLAGGILAIFRLTSIAPADTDIASRICSGGLIMGIAAVAAGIGIGTSGSALASATAEKPELFSRAVVPLILAEALAIYAFVAALLLVI